jgi:hypothetical protein
MNTSNAFRRLCDLYCPVISDIVDLLVGKRGFDDGVFSQEVSAGW